MSLLKKCRHRLKRLIFILVIFISGLARSEDDPRLLFSEVVRTLSSLRDCVVRYREFDSLGTGEQKIYSKTVNEAKYIKEPRLYYHKVVWAEFNYKEQAGAGFQEIYRGDKDLTELLLPGALRLLGLVTLFPEDPKAYGMRGANMKTQGPWDMIGEISAMERISVLRFQRVTVGDKECLEFDITQKQGTYYKFGINRIKLFVDSNTYLPVKIEKYAPEQKEPAVLIEFESFQTNTGLTPKDIKFQGIKGPVSLIKTPSAEEVEPLLKPVSRKVLKEQAPDAQKLLSSFRNAVAQIKDYRADLTMKFRYKRLRLYREDRFAYSREPYWFTLVTKEQKANYLLLNHSAGSVVWLSPDDNNFHIIGGGVQKLLGEQVFSSIDYKFYSPMGDNPYELAFPRLEEMIRNSFIIAKDGAKVVEYQGEKLFELQLERNGETPARYPGRINLVIDPRTNLPRLVELTGYDDPNAFVIMTVDNVKINLALKPNTPNF